MNRIILRSTTILVLISTGIYSSSAAAAFCFAPNAPMIFVTKPTKPFCATDRSCEDWQVRSYQNDVDRYFDKLKQYLRDVENYRTEAYEYAKCMAELR